jgi:hypothetical protein
VPAAFTGGFQRAFWVLGAIALLALPAIFALVRRDELSDAVRRTTMREPELAFALHGVRCKVTKTTDCRHPSRGRRNRARAFRSRAQQRRETAERYER